ncbi:hypothetical protein Btru_042949 [Bulinus truncatus]|nr:hypothetical protein Btru_042949 [Bulinus truncatus]
MKAKRSTARKDPRHFLGATDWGCCSGEAIGSGVLILLCGAVQGVQRRLPSLPAWPLHVGGETRKPKVPTLHQAARAASDLLGCDPKTRHPSRLPRSSRLTLTSTREVSAQGAPTALQGDDSRFVHEHSNTVCCPFLFMSLVNTSEASADTARCMDTGRGGQFCCCPAGFTIDDQCQPKGSIRSDASPPRVGQSMGDVMCGYNQYWSSDKKKCQHCPLCSYMSKPSHKESKCTPCSDSNNPRKAYCPKSCRDREVNVLLRLVISGVIVVTFPLILVPLSMIIVDVAKKYDVI